MDFKDYIKEKYYDAYVQEKENLADRIIEAKYNLLFLKMMYERSEIYRNNDAFMHRDKIRIILRRIYVSVAWELALQVKAFTDDNDRECLTVNRLKNNLFKYLRDEKKQEYYDLLGVIIKSQDWKDCNELVSKISVYRNKIVGHNIVNAPRLTFDINDADHVISQYEKVFKVLNFHDPRYTERVVNMENEMAEYITAYLDAVLPLN